jgi:hypothetical protein
MSAQTTVGGLIAPTCVECCKEFDPAFSPELERCQPCAAFRAWFEGAALLRGAPRLGKAGRLIAATEMTSRAPVGRTEQEV